MSESQEPSYYEVALTNRQVLICFVVLLSAVLGAFLSGVWIGTRDRGEAVRTVDGASGEGDGAAVPDEVARLEEFKFPDEGEGENEPLDKPDLSGLLDKPRQDTTLAQDVGQPGADRKPPEESRPASPPASPPPSPPPSSPPPPPTAPPPSPPPSAATPPASSASTEGFVVQVFSGRDASQARKVKATVERDGYTAFLSSVQQGAMTLYRVRVGPFDSRAAAEKAEDIIKRKHKYDTWVTAASN